MFIDSHAHLGAEDLFVQRKEILERANLAEVEAIIDICTDPLTLERGLAIQQEGFPVFLTAATTPHDVDKEGDLFFPLVKKAVEDKLLVAIGETGLDYYYEHSPKELQRSWLIRYFALASEAKLPIIFHCRDAFEDLFSLSSVHYREGKALVHCFTGTLEEARKALDLGWYISLSGIVTFKKSEELREIAKYIPLDRLMIETDAPYLAPQSRRGQLNESSFIGETAKQIATLKNSTIEEVAACTKANAQQFFSLQY